MSGESINIGKNKVVNSNYQVGGEFIDIDGERYYKIKNFNRMPDFFISIVSDSDHWMFISSNGSLTAGRKDRNNALFPYYTEDKIHDYKSKTGSCSYFIISKDTHRFFWQPFTDESLKFYDVQRNLFKSVYGNSIVFEEINHDLGLSFRYAWHNSERFGFVKKSVISNLNNEQIEIEILDGLRNILPYGADYNFQNEYSNLLNAYKKNERIEGTSIGLYMLSAIPVDKAEPSEALKTTVVWSHGAFNQQNILISDKQLAAFKNGKKLEDEKDIRASRGAYFINSKFELGIQQSKNWYTVAEINQDAAQVANLINYLKKSETIAEDIESDTALGTINLKKLVSYADGFQLTDTELCYVRHYSNTLFNIMRGGVFTNGYMVSTPDFKKYLFQINKLLFNEYLSWLENLPKKILYFDLLSNAKEFKNSDLLRIVYEYLPITFSRRHGDPSRPWNQFSIETKNDDGSTKYNYQGNWRDIFQNWEALSLSFPEYVEGIISKFVNASTFDGYNPYRIMREGIDWESPDPDDPWAYIGYWGDHQIIYLQKLLEISDNFHPRRIDEMLASELFTYARIPYRLKKYEDIVNNPKDTVVFDHQLNEIILSETEHLGGDAKLLKSASGAQIYKVNLMEKLLATLLSKMSNLIPEAGIWMNTQRPEWNDANNALVGNGTSMVTLYYMRRFISFCKKKTAQSKHKHFSVSEEIAKLFNELLKTMEGFRYKLSQGFNDESRKDFTDAMGLAHSYFRERVYENAFTGKRKYIDTHKLIKFFDLAIDYLDQSIRVNRRNDGLYHAYNLVTFSKKTISVRYLYEMLEGQVAILSAGYLNALESLDVLNNLKNSSIFRQDQYSYMLYPNRSLPRFIEKNNIPSEWVAQSELLQKLIKEKEDSIVVSDENGNCHFNGSFTNADKLNEAISNLDTDIYKGLIGKERSKLLDIYEQIFDHKSFTGRSGTFYGYEGLGSIYWHMVSKLLLATQECYLLALKNKADASTLGQLKEHYYEIKAGIGLYKSPYLYGAFPTDAYSHTPLDAGVKQPGLTGQVKEDVISRMGEMGLFVRNGQIVFDTSLLNEEEILSHESKFEYISLKGKSESINLKENQIAFTFCQVPFIYNFSNENSVLLTFENNEKKSEENLSLSELHSKMIFQRTGQIKRVEINFNKKIDVI
jgi:hypothetical protein